MSGLSLNFVSFDKIWRLVLSYPTDLNTDKARDKLINDPNYDITVGQAGIKINLTIDKMVREGYFGNLKPYFKNKGPKDMRDVADYLINHKEEAAAEILGAYKHKYRAYVDTSKTENMGLWAQQYNQGDNNAKPDAVHSITYDRYGDIVNRYMHKHFYKTAPKDPVDYKITDMPSYKEYRDKQDTEPNEWDKAWHGGVVNLNRIFKKL